MQLTFEGRTLDQLAIELIQAYEPQEGYHLCFSGGKDSVVIHDLATRSGVKFVAHYSVSPIDPPEIYDFIKQNYPSVIWDIHARGFWTKHFMSHGAPLRQRRWCCEIIKEAGGEGKTKILGMRQQESSKRKGYCDIVYPKHSKGTWVLPIVRWSNSDVWQYIAERDLSVCSLYKEGFARIGCIMCPFTSAPEMKYEMQRYPDMVQKYKSACIRYYQKRIERGTPLGFKSGEDYFNWWISRR